MHRAPSMHMCLLSKLPNRKNTCIREVPKCTIAYFETLSPEVEIEKKSPVKFYSSSVKKQKKIKQHAHVNNRTVAYVT